MLVFILLMFLVYTLNYVKNNCLTKHIVLTPNTIKQKENGFNIYNQVSLLSVFLLLIVAGLRSYDIGYDLPNYLKNFNLIAENLKIEDGNNFEFLYQSLNYVAAFIFGKQYGFTFLLFIIEIIILYCVCKSIKNYSANATLSMFLFLTVDVYLRGLNQVRQSIAIALVIYSLKYVVNRNFISYLLIILTAVFFHKTVLICLPIYFLWNKEFSWKSLLFIFGLCVLGVFIYPYCIKLFSIIVKKDYYTIYIVNGALDKLSLVGILEVVSYIFFMLIIYIYKVVLEKKGYTFSKSFHFFLYLYSISAALSLFSVLTERSTLFGRLMYYYFWSIIFLVPIFLSTIRNQKWYKIFYVLVVGVALLYYILSLPIINAQGVYPYKFLKI